MLDTIVITQACDTCSARVRFAKVYTGPFWGLEPLDGAHSNHVGTWCRLCIPAGVATARTVRTP